MPTTPDVTLEKLGRLAPRDVQGYVRCAAGDSPSASAISWYLIGLNQSR